MLTLILTAVLALAAPQIPAYWAETVDSKAERIALLQKDEADGFYFWTDSHYPENNGMTPDLILSLIGKTSPRKVFHGGDLLANVNDLRSALSPIEKDIRKIQEAAPLYVVRGNHDLTPDTHAEIPSALPQEETASILRGINSGGLSYDPADGSGCYFFLDNAKAGIRYIALDTSDSVRDGKNIYGISEGQAEWLRATALGTLPEGWKAVVLSHVPLFYGQYASFKPVREALEGAGQGKVLIALSGHSHNDIAATSGGVFHVVGCGDTSNPKYTNLENRFGLPRPLKAMGTSGEQSFDYVSISKDFSKITMVRVGAGSDRIFNLKERKIRRSAKMRTSLQGPVRWFIYDAPGSAIAKDGGRKTWVCGSTLADISENGSVTWRNHWESKTEQGRSTPKNAVVLAVDKDGNQEYFLISSR